MSKTRDARSSSLRTGSLKSDAQPPAWKPPPLQDKFVSGIGSSVVEGFVIGHTHSDVLRELVQNEFDAGGNELIATFGIDGLTVVGNGRPIDRRGWKRLSVILGTGTVIGTGQESGKIPPKANGIGSKNFGLRSLFLFGNRIYVRSAGKMVAMDLPEVGSQSASDPDSRGQKGIAIYVPYRTERFSKLEAFTVDREQTALADMADELLHTVVKLALPNARRSLRNVAVSSHRTGRRLAWHQSANPLRSRLQGVAGIQRHGRLVDSHSSPGESQPATKFDEFEFQRRLTIPTEHRDVGFPGYFRVSSGSLRVGVSLPVRGTHIDLSRHGRFYYPLGSRVGSTGTTVSVNAPFDMDDDRSMPIDNLWNRWLAGEAARLTIDLLMHDWLKRFGGQAYLCVRRQFEASPAWFADAIEAQLQSGSCWSARTKHTGAKVFKKASELVVPTDEALDSFLSEQTYLDSRLANVMDVQTMARDCGARQFTLNSLVRLRCAALDSSHLTTKLQKEEASYYFEDHQSALTDLDRQVRMATTLTKLYRHLSNQNRKDLKETKSTLAADGSLRRALDLLVVDPAVEEVCPVPLGQRLHPTLREFRAIANLCKPFEIRAWMRQVADRLDSGTARDEEREALYQYLLTHGATIDRASLAHLRKRPVVRDHRGNWTAPTELVSRRTAHFNALEPVLHAPSPELDRARQLLRRFKIRKHLTGHHLTAYALHVAKNPALADAFEQTLTRSMNLLTPKTVNQLHKVPFLRSSGGGLASPSRLHLRIRPNLACLEPEDGFVGEGSLQLYRRLKCRQFPSSSALMGALARWRRQGRGPRQPEVFYPILAASLQHERQTVATLKNEEILWVNGSYHTPEKVLVGPTIPRCFRSVLPHVHGPEALCKAYETLGAHRSPIERHWRDLLLWFGRRYEEDASPSAEERRALVEAYRKLGEFGLPDGVPDTARFLLSRDGTIHSMADLNEGRYVENDYPELADAIRQHQASVAFAELTDETRKFLTALGLKTLTTVCRAGRTEIGEGRNSPVWFLGKHEARLQERMHQAEFVDALLKVAWAFKRRGGQFELPERTALESRFRQILHISFAARISRTYRVADRDVPVTVEVAAVEDRIVLASAASLQEIGYLVAYGLVQLLGPATVEDMRSLALLVSPLLQCRSTTETATFLRRQGVPWSAIQRAQQESAASEDAFEETPAQEDVSEQVLRQLLSGLETSRTREEGDTERRLAQPDTTPPPPITPDTAPERILLPTISQVELTVLDRTASWIAPAPSSGGERGTGSSWSPPSPRDVERDLEIGKRGEELVYRQELARLRACGHDSPEKLVTWTSQTDAGADHDIRSVAEDGKTLWIEVKSTMGIDGRFDWAKKEFQKALREGDHYELWRVYEAHTEHPTAKPFRNPVSLFGEEALKLDIGSLRAVVEPMHVDSAPPGSTAKPVT